VTSSGMFVLLRRFAGWSLISVSPLTRMYSFRARLLNYMGFTVSSSVRCVSSARFFLSTLTIGEDTFVGHEVRIFGGADSVVSIGSRVDIAPRVMLLAGTHEIGDPDRRAGKGCGTTITVENGVWIGAGATIVGPAHLGTGCIIAAGEVVRGDVPANALRRSGADIPLRSRQN
jgi:maltose O-acetyltransferase